MQFDTRSLWIYIYFPQLQLDLLETSNTEAVAIVDTSTNTLCQVNHSASKLGVRLGMGLASASLIHPDLHLHEYNHELESQAITNIANQLYLFTSDIALMPPQALVLRAQNMLNLYGGLQGYWHVIEQCLGECFKGLELAPQQKLYYVAASAYSVQGAKVLALSHQNIITEDRNSIEKKLLISPLINSDIDKKDIHKLARIGIKTYGDLSQLALPEVANRVSRVSMNIINELAGKQAARVRFYQPQSTYSDYLELLYEVSLSAKLLPVLGRCLHRLSDFLLLRNAHSLSIDVTFFQRDHDSFSSTFNSMRPIYKASDWLDIIKLQIESIVFLSPVYAIKISCLKHEVADIANDDMFAKKSSHVARLTLLSRLQSKLGKMNIQRLQFTSDFRPEVSSTLSAIAHDTNDKVKNAPNHLTLGGDQQTKSIFADRPGFLLPKPQPLSLNVKVLKGPERIQTGWWDDSSINRDYYIGQSECGQQVWIFKTPTKEWFLHGYFI